MSGPLEGPIALSLLPPPLIFFPPSTLIIGLPTGGLHLKSGIYCHRYYVNSELISGFAHRIIVRMGLRDHVICPLDMMNGP